MEYNRMVAYIYAYCNEIKDRNAGFAKIEVRNDIVKMNINMKGAIADGISDWKVNFFYRDGGYIIPIELGHMSIHGGMGQFLFSCNAIDIFEKGVGFSSICGLYLISDTGNGKLFASEWDDLGFDIRKIGKPATPVTEEPINVESAEPDYTAAEVVVEVPEIANEMNGFEMLFAGKGTMPIFADDDIYNIIEITPDDILKMPNTNWGLKNNSFLNHGFYNYRHLILGKTRNPAKSGYVIGVPGMYTRRERGTAAMYGFNRFKFSMRSDIRLGQFGYWYIELDD